MTEELDAVHPPLEAIAELAACVGWPKGTPVEALELTTRTFNSLKRAKVLVLGDMEGRPDRFFTDMRYFGDGAMEDLRSALRRAARTDHP